MVFAKDEIQTISDLRVLNKQVEDSGGLPVLILFTTEDCDYCEAIRENYLLPMIRSKQYASKILFRQLYIEDYRYLRNKDGQLIGGDSIALRYDVDVTPTILFIDKNWKELTDRIVGINGPDYFDDLLKRSIFQASLKLSDRKH